MSKLSRHAVIRDLLSDREVGSQDELRRILFRRGHHVTQATLSRDIHELGLVKTAEGYKLPQGEDGELALPSIERLIQTFVYDVKTALNQVITNLLGNAAKFVKPGMVPEINVRGEDRGSAVRLWIEDNGIGIEPADQERIFDMFIQVHEPGQYGGTGIGLAIVKKAAQTMRGAVGVESKEGEGSRFWVDLNKVA